MKKALSLAALLALSTSAFADFNDSSDGDEFIFRDNTGDIVIEVDNETWNRQEVHLNDRISIEGKVDRVTFRKSTINVHHIHKM